MTARKTIYVAGIARSGLTATMQMLHAGGYPCAGERPAFEPYDVCRIPWKDCTGMAVKVVDAQIQTPPPGDYKIIRLNRNKTEQAKSTNKFVGAFCGLPPMSLGGLKNGLKKDYVIIDRWAKKYPTLVLNFEDIINHPLVAASAVDKFVGGGLDTSKMARCIINRGPECHPTLLELVME